MAAVDTVRLERLQRMMAEAGFDALVCRLPENVTYITNYWPHHGVSVAVLFREGQPMLFVPEVEKEYTDVAWAEVESFGWLLLGDPDVYDSFRRVLGGIAARLSLGSATVGVERNAEIVGPTYRSAEPIVPAAPWHAMLEEVFAGAKLVDATGLLEQARGIKTDYEIAKMRVAAEIAEMGMRHGLANMQPGMTEAQIGALVEYKIRADGPGHDGARLVRPLAEVAAGLNTVKATLLVPSTDYVTRAGDMVMIEMGLIVDGYWSDLTYMGIMGEPNERQREVHNIVLEAELAATAATRAGVPMSEPDRIAREVLGRAGLAEYYPHITGHGIGLRYHEWTPLLMPGNDAPLAPGMVTSVEPGVYIPGFGGIRIEDNVVVGAEGPILLSTPRKPW
jgi:Xaa-Pro dipeptidase